MKSTGVVGWIHAAVPAYNEYVFTYRAKKPNGQIDFFRFVNLSMVGATDEVKAQFATFKRNDQVKVVGSYLNIPSPQKHILVTSIAMVKAYDTQEKPYQHQTQLPDALDGKTPLYGVVHAQAMNGGALVVEYKDAVLPVFVSPKHRAMVATLYKGDIIGLHYTIQAIPPAPFHLETDAGVDDAVQVIDHMVWCNQKGATLTGELVLFPKSPEINMDIYAMRVTDGNGMQRNFTLTSNLDTDKDMSIFSAIHAKTEKVWTQAKGSVVQGRNQLINPKVRVTAQGIMNDISQQQANPQIYLPGPDAVTFDVQP